MTVVAVVGGPSMRVSVQPVTRVADPPPSVFGLPVVGLLMLNPIELLARHPSHTHAPSTPTPPSSPPPTSPRDDEPSKGIPNAMTSMNTQATMNMTRAAGTHRSTLDT